MAIPFEQSIVNWLILGGLVAVLYGLRYLVVLERRMVSLELSVQRMLRKVELDERRILAEERLIEKKILRKPTAKKRRTRT